MTEAQQMIAVAIGVCTLLGLLIGYVRWWVPRWRRIKQRFDGAVDVLFGRPAIVDPASGRVVSPKLPSLGERLVGFDQDVETLKQTVAPVASDVAAVKKQVTENHHSNPEPTLPDRLSDVRKDVAELHDDVRVVIQAQTQHFDWSQEWTSRVDRLVDEHQERLDDHERRLKALEAHRCEPER